MTQKRFNIDRAQFANDCECQRAIRRWYKLNPKREREIARQANSELANRQRDLALRAMREEADHKAYVKLLFADHLTFKRGTRK